MKLGTRVLPLVMTLAAAAIGPADSTPRTGCFCPQRSPGWLLFADSSRRTPDFWWQDEIVVQEIARCPHGIHFLFVAEERGNLYLVALVFTDPPPRIGGDYRTDVSSPGRELANLRARLAELLAGSGEESDRMDFRHTPIEERPRIVQPWRRLALAWQSQEIELRGYLDVYLTLIV